MIIVFTVFMVSVRKFVKYWIYTSVDLLERLDFLVTVNSWYNEKHFEEMFWCKFQKHW